jgi:uncharacterized protein (DUF433 family)
MDWQDYIEQRPDVLGGKPVIRGTRISVEHIVDRFADAWSVEDLLASYPQLSAESVRAALKFAARSLASDQWIMLDRAAS